MAIFNWRRSGTPAPAPNPEQLLSERFQKVSEALTPEKIGHLLAHDRLQKGVLEGTDTSTEYRAQIFFAQFEIALRAAVLEAQDHSGAAVVPFGLTQSVEFDRSISEAASTAAWKIAKECRAYTAAEKPPSLDAVLRRLVETTPALKDAFENLAKSFRFTGAVMEGSMERSPLSLAAQELIHLVSEILSNREGRDRSALKIEELLERLPIHRALSRQ